MKTLGAADIISSSLCYNIYVITKIAKQFIPKYIEDFRNDKRWIKKESTHYIFYYFTNSIAEHDILTIEEIQEKSFKKILSVLKVRKPKEKIKYYFYPSKNIKYKLTGDSGYAQAIYAGLTVHMLYTKQHKPIGEHEDTHLLSLPLGLATGFFAEGLAEYFSWNRIVLGKKKDQWLIDGENKILPIEKIVSHKGWIETPDNNFMYHYSFAGYFITRLIKDFGISKFKRFYKEVNRDMNFLEINDVFIKYSKTDIRFY